MVAAVCCAAQCVAAGGGYVVAADKTTEDGDWRKVVEALAEKHCAEVVRYDGREALPSLLAELRKTCPKYVCFVAKPESVGRDFVHAAHEAMRRIDDDPYGDAIWGIVTAYDAGDALRLVNAPLERKVKSVATSMGGPRSLDGWESGFASDERTADNFWVKRPGGETEKVPTGGNIAKALAGAFNSVPVDYFVTSGHAREHDWQIIYNQNKGRLVHNKSAALIFTDPAEKKFYPLETASLKVYIGAGNCLIGHVDRRDCMVTAWIRSAGVEQFCGYTVPSWYGFMGWGVKGLYETGRYSLAEARFLENERLLWAKANSHPAREDRGLDYDRDVFVYYGDPAQRIMLPEDRTPYKTAVKGGRVRVEFVNACTFPPVGDVKSARPVTILFDEPPQGNALFDVNGVEVPCSVVTERFVFIPAPGAHEKGETTEYVIGPRRRQTNVGIAATARDAGLGVPPEHEMWRQSVEMHKGVTLRAYALDKPRLMKAFVARIDLGAPGVGFTATDRDAKWGEPMPDYTNRTVLIDTKRETTPAFMMRRRAAGEPVVLAVNASPWVPWDCSAAYRSIYGSFRGWNVSHGVELSQPGKPKKGPLFVVYKDGRADVVSAVAESRAKDVEFVFSGFGLIMTNGVPTAYARRVTPRLSPRTVLGLDAGRKTLVLLVVDGRQPNYSIGALGMDLYEILRKEGVTDAVDMDGGGSSTITVFDAKRGAPWTLNRPSDGRPRRNALNVGILLRGNKG